MLFSDYINLFINKMTWMFASEETVYHPACCWGLSSLVQLSPVQLFPTLSQISPFLLPILTFSIFNFAPSHQEWGDISKHWHTVVFLEQMFNILVSVQKLKSSIKMTNIVNSLGNSLDWPRQGRTSYILASQVAASPLSRRACKAFSKAS